MGWKRLEYDSYRLDRERASATTAGALSLQPACTLSARRDDVIENEKQSKLMVQLLMAIIRRLESRLKN